MRKLNLLFKSFLLLCALIAGSTAWAETKTITAAALTDGVLTDSPFTLTFAKNNGTNAPTYNQNGGDLRLYAKGTVEVSSSGGKITQIVFNLSAQGKKRLAPITASVGSISTQTAGDETVTWTGNAESVVFTVGDNAVYGSDGDSKAGQLCFSSVNITYTSTAAPKCATPTFTPAAGAYTSAQNVTIACETAGATIYYTTDGTAPTASSNVYASAIPVSTTTTIKAMAAKAGNSNSDVATATYTILAHAGTEADPYTVADARAAIDANAGLTDVYATGIVSGIVTAYNSDYKNISFNISTDGETTSDQLQAYRCEGIENVTDASKVQVGDIVVIKGNLTKYNSTYEFAQGNQLISLQKSQKTTPTSVWKISGNTVTSIVITKGGSFTATFETNSTGTKSFESSNTEVATVSNTGVISLTGKAGIATITASTASNNTYIASEAKLLIVIGEPVEDGVFNFGNCQDYGSGIVPGDEYYTAASTWTAGNVTLNVNGKYRWYIASSGKPDFRFYANETNSMTFSAPNGYVITSIKGLSTNLKYNDANLTSTTWTGKSQSVTFTTASAITFTDITVYYSTPTISVTMGEAGWMTYSNVGAALSFEGVTAYRVSSVAEDHVNLIPITEAPANTPVLLKAAPGVYNLTVIASAEKTGTNKLSISDGTKTSDETYNVYALAKKNDVVGFYKVHAGVMVPAGKCFISVKIATEQATARDFLGFIEEGATSINAIENGQSTDEVFDLQGRQVKQPTKGLYIKNGKKVIIK